MQQSKKNTFSIKNAIMFGLKTFWTEKWLFTKIIFIAMLGLLAVFLITFALGTLGIISTISISKITTIFFNQNFREIVAPGEGTFSGIKGLYALLAVLAIIWSFLGIGLGVKYISCKLYDHRVVEVTDLFSKYGLIGTFIFGHILYSLISITGMILLIIPGIIWGVRFGLFSYAIVDKNMSATQSLRYSYQITKNNFMRLFGLSLLTGLFSWPLQLLKAPEAATPTTQTIVGITIGLLSYCIVMIQSLIHAYAYKKLSEDRTLETK